MKLKRNVLSIIMSIAILLAIPIVSKASNETITLNVNVTNDYSSAYEVLKIVNKERTAIGLSELQMDKDLMDAAMIRASELSLYFSHTRPNGTSCFTASSKANGENIAAGYSTPEYVMQGWMESAGHKANILGENYQTIGIGAIKYGSLCYWVQLFGTDNINAVSTIPSNKKITSNIEILKDNVELYYNSLSEIYQSWYPNGFDVRIVVLNKGWQGRCVVVDPSDLMYDISNNSVASIDKNGKIRYNSAGEISLTAKLKEFPSISVTKKIKIKGQLSCTQIDDIQDVKYTGKNVKPNVTITDGKKILIKNKDYKLEYTNNKSCGIASVKIIGMGLYEGSYENKTFKIVPSKVEKIKVTSANSNSITINWNKVKDVTAYKVYVYDYVKRKYEYYGKTSCNNIKIKNLKSSTKYKVRVKAYKNVNGVQYFGEYSKGIKVTTAPKKVTNIKVKYKNNNSVKINWKSISGATGYKVYMYNSKTKKYEYFGKSKNASITIKNLSKNKKYKIKIRAYKTFNNKQYFGNYSDVLKVTIKK